MKVTVNGEVFSHDICMFRLQQVIQEKPGLPEDEAKKEVAETLIKHALLKQEARKKIGHVPEARIDEELDRLKQNYPTEDDFQRMCAVNRTTEAQIREEIEDSIRTSLFIRELTKHIPPPPTHIMKKYYEREAKISMTPREIKAAHIVKPINPDNPEATYQELLAVRKKLLAGGDFAEFADRYSSCNDKGGDLGWFARGKMVEEFDVIAFSMEKNEISPIFQTPFGYHIVKVYDIREPRRKTFEECKNEIKAEITAKLQDEQINKWIDKKRPEADIEVEY